MASLRKSVDKMCKQCIYDPAEPGAWRQQVEACKITTCPLFNVRPLSVKTVNKRRAERRN